MRFAVLGFLCAAVFGLSAGNAIAQEAPLRVAIVGLEHGHVGVFLKQFPNQHDVQLVGIVDADTELCHRYAQRFISIPACSTDNWTR